MAVKLTEFMNRQPLPEQLTFDAVLLAEQVSRLLRIEDEKKEANENWNGAIKLLKKEIVKLSNKIDMQRLAVPIK